MTPRQKTIGVTAAVVVSVLTFTTYNPVSDQLLSTGSTNLLNKDPEIKKDTLLYQKTTADKYTPGYGNPMEE